MHKQLVQENNLIPISVQNYCYITITTDCAARDKIRAAGEALKQMYAT